MPIYSRRGDQGKTKLIGGVEVLKSDLIIEVLGAIDEADAALGVARSVCQTPSSGEILIKVQKDLWLLMADIASTSEEIKKNNMNIGEDHVIWIEKQIDVLTYNKEIPKNLIIPGDSFPAAMLDLARTITRRAERRMVSFCENAGFYHPWVVMYLNRLSSLVYALELKEIFWKEE